MDVRACVETANEQCEGSSRSTKYTQVRMRSGRGGGEAEDGKEACMRVSTSDRGKGAIIGWKTAGGTGDGDGEIEY